jgi:hypothetical protein
MRRVNPRARAGITLTEILIAILIMGVGLISLATLFPLGLTRLRDATRYSRSALLSESAGSELGARNMLNKFSFFASPWYITSNGISTFPYDPWTYDPYLSPGAPLVAAGSSPGLPVAYDPLWWSVVDQTLGYEPNSPGFNSRFAASYGYMRNDPSDGGAPSAYGLQRITNFIPYDYVLTNPAYGNWPFTYPIPRSQLYVSANVFDVSGDTFTSRDDIVFQNQQGATTNPAVGIGSPLVPDMSQGQVMNDWTYSWLFTGQQASAMDPTVFTGDVVVFHNRPLGVETVNSPFAGPVTVPAGERVIEAVFGNTGTPINSPGYSPAYEDRVVLLRWSVAMPDPDVRVGSWIADVTYDLPSQNSGTRFPGPYPGQRCYWYQIVKRNPAGPDPYLGANFRSMTVVVNTAVKAKTLLQANGIPQVLNAALIDPYVVNVFPKTVYVR